MKVFEFTSIFRRNSNGEKLNPLKSISNKRLWLSAFLLSTVLFYAYDYLLDFSNTDLEDNTLALQQYGNDLRSNIHSTSTDTIIVHLEREQLLRSIEERLVTYLYQVPDYRYLESLEPYFRFAPEILGQIPSAVPLEKGDYSLSSNYGIRKHPISGKEKKHYGIDLAAGPDKYVYASASGTVLFIIHSEAGYGTHIIIKHRFGFETLYGHLNKVLVGKGQKIKQHELIGTVGTTGSSTGYHLHYEIIKNGTKIDPAFSLNLKNKIYQNLYSKQTENGTTQEKKNPEGNSRHY